MTSPAYRFLGARPDGAARTFTTGEWWRLAALYGAIAILHIAGFGLYLRYVGDYPALVGLGLAAYLFGVRHAFDADHIAAIDDTVRLLLQKGQRPLAVGFFFSLGHCTVVLALALAIALAAGAVRSRMPGLAEVGGIIGGTVSGAFLWLVGILNLLVLLDVVGVWKKARFGTHDHAHLEAMLANRGLLNRLFGGRLQRLMRHSWQMYPLGFLFGLGFDTATEIGLLAMTAGAATGNLPLPAVLALPLLFAAGMTLMDTTDGVLMVKAYDWATVNPLRRIYYNIVTTGLSVALALFIGTLQLLQVAVEALGLRGGVFDTIADVELGALGYVIVAMFLLAWAGSVLLWKLRRLDEPGVLHSHFHRHADGTVHAHRHLH